MPPCFDPSKHDGHIECYKQFTISSNIAKRKSEGEGISTLSNTRRVQRSVEGAKQLFPKGCRIFIYSGPIKIKYKKLFPHLLLQQTSADAIVRFTNIKKDGDWKLSPMIKLLESEFLTHDKCYRKYTRWPKDEAVRSLKLQARNVNT